MKVYCKQCKYKFYRLCNFRCKHPNHIIYMNDFFSVRKIYRCCMHINSNNDCKNFEASLTSKLIKKIKEVCTK